MIVEPVVGNLGVVPLKKGIIAGLHSLTEDEGALPISNIVMTGFRGHPGEEQALYQVALDLKTLGKAIGGGFPNL